MKNIFILLFLFIFLNSNLYSQLWNTSGQYVKKTDGIITGDLQVQDFIVTGTETIQGSEFSVGNSTFVIKNGMVGIGTNTPNMDLHIKNIVPSMRIQSGTGQSANIYMPDIVNRWLIQRSGAYDLLFYDYTTPAGNRLTLKSGGNVGISSTSPSCLFTVADGTMCVKSNGMVGIGTGSPLQKLKIEGGAFAIYSRTKAEIFAIDPVEVGEQYYCSNCTISNICISTGIAVGNFSDLSAKTTACN